jgi:plasmid maintenance system antidote protein VapI
MAKYTTQRKAINNILVLSHEKNIRHTEFAKALGVSDARISQIMHGKKPMPMEYLGTFAKVLGVTESRLLR